MANLWFCSINYSNLIFDKQVSWVRVGRYSNVTVGYIALKDTLIFQKKQRVQHIQIANAQNLSKTIYGIKFKTLFPT